MPHFLILSLMAIGMSLGVGGLLVHVVPLLTDLGAERGRATEIASLLGLASVCGRVGVGLLLDRFSVTPVVVVGWFPVGWQQVTDWLTIAHGGDAGEDVGEVVVGVDSVQFAGFDEAGDGGPVFGTEIVSGEERIFSLESHFPHGSFDWVVIEIDPAIVKEPDQAAPMVLRIVDGGQRG